MLSRDEPSSPAPPVRRVERVFSITHSLDYRYPMPVRNVVRHIRLFPPPIRGAQHLRQLEVNYAPLPTLVQENTDMFGNSVREVHYETAAPHLTLVVELEVENSCLYAADGQIVSAYLPATEGVPAEGETAFLQPTSLTFPDDALRKIAAEYPVPQDATTAKNLAFELCRKVYAGMHYARGATTVHTTAAETWRIRKGVCQDYAHVLLALCRLVGIPARYASGFLPGEGAMHAWIEVLLPGDTGSGGWIALDPTHSRWVNERYITIAAGRDYADVTPTAGTFTGKGPNVLSHRSRVVVKETKESAVSGGSD